MGKKKILKMATVQVLEASQTAAYVRDTRAGKLLSEKYELVRGPDNRLVRLGDSAVSQAFKLFSWGLNKTVAPETVSSIDRKISVFAGSAVRAVESARAYPDHVFNAIDEALDTSFPDEEEESDKKTTTTTTTQSSPVHAPLIQRPLVSAKKAVAFSSRASSRAVTRVRALVPKDAFVRLQAMPKTFIPKEYLDRVWAAKDALFSKDFLATVATLVLHLHDRVANVHASISQHHTYKAAASRVPASVSKLVSDADERVVRALRTVQADGEDDEEEVDAITKLPKAVQNPRRRSCPLPWWTRRPSSWSCSRRSPRLKTMVTWLSRRRTIASTLMLPRRSTRIMPPTSRLAMPFSSPS